MVDIKTVAFTGSRPNKLNGYKAIDNKELLWKIAERVEKFIVEENVTTFINGLALGIDTWTARIVLKLKEKYPHIKLISASPCLNHNSKWNKESQEIWQEVVDKSDEFIIVTEEEYKPYLMQVRNMWMVDRADIILAVFDGTPGGTMNCVKYAEKQNKRIEIIDTKE